MKDFRNTSRDIASRDYDGSNPKAEWIGERMVELLNDDSGVLIDAECASKIDTDDYHQLFTELIELKDYLPERIQKRLEGIARYVATDEFNKNKH